jgi:patatin-related protein
MTGRNSLYNKELRIALVCYGGVSLAVYMHGVTKELYKLIRASRAFDAAFDQDASLASVQDPFAEEGGGSAGGPEYDTERAYFAALIALARAGKPVTAVIDLISGTSAGGINGVCLARAIAHSRSLNGFRAVWIDQGDLEGLLEGHGIGFTHEERMLVKLALAVGKLAGDPGETGAPLNGALMSQLLHAALRDMKAVTGQGPTLVRDDGSLDLYVTTTDMYGHDTAIPTGTGVVAHTDRSYRQLLGFSYEQGVADDLGDESVPGLAFAARATSSFPGAFPPVSLLTFAAAVQDSEPGTEIDPAKISARFIDGEEYGAKPADSWFIDGGVLDNGPFDHVVEAIAAKRAETETAREIVYIEPDPGPPPAEVTGPAATPTWFRTVWASRTTIPQHEPLIGALGQLRDMNSAIAEVSRIAEAQMSAVLPFMAETHTDARADYDTVAATAQKVRDKAKDASGLAYTTYCRLRAEAVADAIAVAIARQFRYPPQSNQAWFVWGVLGAWARAQQAWLDGTPAMLEVELGAVDLPFRDRRAEFMLQGINALFASSGEHPLPTRADLGQLKAACWALLTDVRSMASRALAAVGDELAVLSPALLTGNVVVGDPQQYAEAHNDELTVLFRAYKAQLAELSVGSSRDLWDTFGTITQSWDHPARDQLASRYLAFPIWDALIFPTIALAGLPQLSPIGVTRFSPLDATRLIPVDAHGSKLPPGKNGLPPHKLKGRTLGHFGGFFEKEWRENDYLWGRLDGAELILGLLSRSAGGTDLTTALKEALTAILTTESPALGDMRDVIAGLTTQVDDI